MLPLTLLETIATSEGELQLRQRGASAFLITLDGRVLMTSSDRRSEEAVATLACKELASVQAPRVLISGLGMGYTLRAALDMLPPAARVTVVELTPEVATWCRGPLAPLTRGAVLDPRVEVVIDDVSRVIEAAPAGSYDAIILDLYEGPHAISRGDDEPFYGRRALARSHAALSPGGVLSIWSEEVNEPFTRRMKDAGFATSGHRPGGTRAYGIYVGIRSAQGRRDVRESPPPAGRRRPRS